MIFLTGTDQNWNATNLPYFVEQKLSEIIFSSWQSRKESLSCTRCISARDITQAPALKIFLFIIRLTHVL